MSNRSAGFVRLLGAEDKDKNPGSFLLHLLLVPVLRTVMSRTCNVVTSAEFPIDVDPCVPLCSALLWNLRVLPGQFQIWWAQQIETEVYGKSHQ